MNPKELNELLLVRFPNLKDAFDEETSWQDGIETGSTIVFEDVFMPYIVFCFENKMSEELNKCFDFVEECVLSKDDYQKTVIEISIIQNIHSYDIADDLVHYLREESLKSYNH